MIRYQKDTNNIVTLTLDMRGRPDNIINHSITEAFFPVVEHLKKEKARKALRGVIITSAKKTFLAGGNLEYLSTAQDPKEIYLFAQNIKQLFRELERPGVPVVAAINGSALGLGFELALACHHRIVVKNPNTRIGLPEVTLGLMPSCGGNLRLMWLLGIEKAFPILESGHRYRPMEALRAGIIDEVVPDEKTMMERARTWLLQTKEGRRPWDLDDGKIPGGTANNLAMAHRISLMAAQVAKKYQNNFPAPKMILNTLSECSKVDFDTASRIDSRNYAYLLRQPEAKNMIQAFWFDYNAVRTGENRPKGFGKFRPKKVGVIGAGMMGSGIAFACLLAGMEVILKDVSRLIAERGRDTARSNLKKMVELGKIEPGEMEHYLKRITTTDAAQDFETCDLVIEAVFENENVKAKVTKEAEEFMDEYSLFGSNSISLPITRLAQHSLRPENYVGLHFFRPVEENRLVEIVRGKQTSQETLARAFDFVKAIKKMPILVEDTWGFYAARVQNTYILEGITMLSEGLDAALIENLGKATGMPKGSLELADELSLKLILNYEGQAAEHYGPKYIQHPAVEVLHRMLDEFERPGGKSRRGFYDKNEQGQLTLWTELAHHFPTRKKVPAETEIMQRFLIAQVLESLWCLQEGVIGSVAEANIGSLFGWGFPAYKGGVIQFLKEMGSEAFIKKCKSLEKVYGPRYKVPSMVKKGLKI